MKIYAPWEKSFKKFIRLLFLHAQITTGFNINGHDHNCLLLANSPFYEIYQHFIHTKIELDISSLVIKNFFASLD